MPRLWLPLPQTASGYQTTQNVRWQGTGTNKLVRDEAHGAAILFSNWTADAADRRVEVVQTVATDIELPGSRGKQPNFAFLMYPCAFTAAGQPDTLDPAAFHYEIASREIVG